MLARVWGPLAHTMAVAIVARPSLGRRLSLAPERVVHAIAAYVHHRLAEKASPRDIATEIDERDVRDLLAAAVPNPHPRLFALLDRCGSEVRSPMFYTRLNTILDGPAAPLIFDPEKIDPEVLTAAERSIADPVLLAANRAIGANLRALDGLETVLSYLRATGLARSIERLPPGSGWSAVLRRVTADAGRATMCDLPCVVPEGWRVIPTVSALMGIGREMSNCLARWGYGGEHRLQQAMTRRAVFLATTDLPLILAVLEPAGPTQWYLSETSVIGPRLRLARGHRDLERDLGAALHGVGHVLLRQSPWGAMSGIGTRAEGLVDVPIDDGLDGDL